MEHRTVNCLLKKSQITYKKLLELISELSKDSKYKDNILKEPLTTISENMNYLGINLTKYMQTLYAKQ